jgi:hypothetical protein
LSNPPERVCYIFDWIVKLTNKEEIINWVIDFKTAKPAENEPLNKFIQRQQNQHDKQLRFYKTDWCFDLRKSF